MISRGIGLKSNQRGVDYSSNLYAAIAPEYHVGTSLFEFAGFITGLLVVFLLLSLPEL